MKVVNPPLIVNKSAFKNTLFGLFIAISIITNSGYVGMMAKESRPVFFLIPLSFGLFFMYIKKNRKILLNYTTVSLSILISFIIVTFMLNREFGSINLYLYLLLMIFSSYLLTEVIPFDDFVNGYILVVKNIAIISLFFYSLWNFFNYRIPFSIFQTRYTSYYNGLVYFQLLHSPERNVGIFWEPGLFASFLVIALLFLIIFKGLRNNYGTFSILLLGLISTQSTAGYLLLPFLLLLILFKKVDYRSGVLLIFILLIISITGSLFYTQIMQFLVNINPKIFSKFLDDSVTLNTRLLAPTLNLNIFMSSPIFGVGFSKATSTFIEKSYLYNIASQTSTSTYFLASMGIAGIIYTYNWIEGIFKLKTKLIIKLITAIIFIIILNKEPHNSLFITYCIMFYFLSSTKTTENLNTK